MHPETQSSFHALLIRAADRDPDALAFLHSFTQYFHDVCEFCSAPQPAPDPFIHLLARTCTVHSLPYYVRNAHFLHLPVQRALSNFALVLSWKDHGQTWKADFARSRNCLIADVILAVADLKAIPFAAKQALATDLLELLSSLTISSSPPAPSA